MELNANHPTDKEQEFQSMVLDADKEREVQSMVLDTQPTDKTLQAIRYIRGALQLIDQRKLPAKTVYLDIQDVDSGWQAMWDMAVWGTQALAFVAALSLAVEVANFKDFNGTSKDAATHLQYGLKFFVSSWPTVVNIENVAKKLIQIASNAVATATVPGDVFQAYIEAAENMFLEDVASNKAIGFYGASFLQLRLENPKRFSVLTHANAGSLATTGYGTALSIIRALHADGVLETAYCTETRPSNQGSRLTTFELVHDNINATLITDSAAGALMKERRVSAVIVGAVSVAANGDTLIRVGSYSLALCAMYHGIPFYVAAPIHSIDLSVSTGQNFVIMEGPKRELLGEGKEQDDDESGICVRNPFFDITPANLITGIITEKGVIEKINAFDIKDFIEKKMAILR